MKKLYIVARNHMDPSWLRCFEDHFTNDAYGGVVRPYADVEELQILEYMDFAEKYGVKYHIEQSLVVKKLLERNPDQVERFKKLVNEGLLELAGGGETVIDMNMTQGESWARNHLYSRKYYKEEFDHAPRYAITPDIFGLPSQLPQFFRSIDYDALIIFDRVMKNNKPFWQGLDGTKIVLDSCWLNVPEPGLRTADCTKIRACPVCRGEGCDACEGTGIDFSYNMTRLDKDMSKFRESYYGNMSAEEILQQLLEKDSPTGEYFCMIVTEEPRVGDELYGPLKDAAAKMGFEVEYLTFEENHDRWCAGQVDALRRGDYTEDEVDTRVEGNHVFTGCYSSRIEIKKANRELEDFLLEAERLTVLAKLNGGWNVDSVPRRDYPQKKLEALWSKMSFIQFHDCLPGSICDGSYYEVIRYIREVRRGAEQVYNGAALECLRSIGCEVPEGYNALIHFNTNTQDASNIKLKFHIPPNVNGVEIFDKDLNKLGTYGLEKVEELVGSAISVNVVASVPAMGWKIFLWKPSEELSQLKACNELKIENEFFVVKVANGRISEIFDKKNNRLAATDSGLNIGVETGSPWGRGVPETRHEKLIADSVSCEVSPDFGKLIFKGVLSDESRRIEKLEWKLTVSLAKGENLVRFASDLDWNGTNSRVFASVTPAFEHTGKLWCDVPFGLMERGVPQLSKAEQIDLPDEWPSLGLAGVSNGEYNISYFKGGFPGARVHEDDLQVILLRAFESGDPKYQETNDLGKHSAEFAISTWTGSFSGGNAPLKAAMFNRHGLTRAVSSDCGIVSAGEGCMLPALTNIPEQLCLSALKWAEDGSSPIVRFWESVGSTVTLKLPENVKLVKCNTLEAVCDGTQMSEYTFRPFEIATFKLIID